MVMMCIRRLAWFCRGAALAWALLLLPGCETTPSAGPENAPPVFPPEILRPGDKLMVEFQDVPGIQPSVQTIREDGSITLHLNVSVIVAGMTKRQAEEEIRKAYVPRFYTRLTAVVKPEDRFYFVGGEVRGPSRQVFQGELTVLKAIQSAGDFTDFAKKKAVKVTRLNGKTITVNCLKAIQDPKFDIPIFPGDRIHVPRRYF